MEKADDYYVFDPSVGVICTSCKVAIRIPEGWLIRRCIAEHEKSKTHKNFGRPLTTDNERDAISTEYDSYIVGCVATVQQCLPCIKTASKTFLSLVGTTQLYDYCMKCNVLTTIGKDHNSKKCIAYIHSKRNGVKNSWCVRSNPKIIIVDEFDVNDKRMLEKYACQKFIDLWYSKRADDTKTSQLFELFQLQKAAFDSHQQSMTIQHIDNKKTPNLYASTLSWGTALEKCKYSDINKLKIPDQYGKYEYGIGNILERCDGALWFGLKQCQLLLQPMHPVLGEMGTTDGGKTKSRLVLEKDTATWKRYFGHVQKIVLILFRMWMKAVIINYQDFQQFNLHQSKLH
jgi:hypothetical protein